MNPAANIIKGGSISIRPYIPENVKTIRVKTAVWLNSTQDQALPAGHPEAAFLLAGPNGNVKVEDAERLGITEDGAPGADSPKKEPKTAKAAKTPKAAKSAKTVKGGAE